VLYELYQRFGISVVRVISTEFVCWKQALSLEGWKEWSSDENPLSSFWTIFFFGRPSGTGALSVFEIPKYSNIPLMFLSRTLSQWIC